MESLKWTTSEHDEQVLLWLIAHVGEGRVQAAAAALATEDGQSPAVDSICRYLGLNGPIISPGRFADGRALQQRRMALMCAVDRQRHPSPSLTVSSPAATASLDGTFAQQYRLAAAALERAMHRAISACLGMHVTDHQDKLHEIRWQTLLDIETLAYAYPEVASLDRAVLDSFPRLRDSRWLPANRDELADLVRDDDDMPVIMLVVRAAQRALLSVPQ